MVIWNLSRVWDLNLELDVSFSAESQITNTMSRVPYDSTKKLRSNSKLQSECLTLDKFQVTTTYESEKTLILYWYEYIQIIIWIYSKTKA